jgi:guanosine-3',5'-bis(diphosphate) 3'-pyrophosphohydrolase
MSKYLTCILAAALVSGATPAPDMRPQVSLHSAIKTDLTEENLQKEVAAGRAHLSTLTKDNVRTMQAFDALAEETLNAYHQEKSLSKQDVLTILEGVRFAAEKHQGQTRKNKEQTPYISHPIGVAVHVMQIGKVRDVHTILAALLHDTVEDTNTSYEEIQKAFGATVAGYVNELTDNKALPKEERKRLQVVNASHKSQAAAQIKLADKLYNLNDLMQDTPENWSRNRVDLYFEWAQSVISRLPQANDPLKKAVEEKIATYWEQQAKTQKK